LDHAIKLRGHTEQEITEKVYRRVGEVVKPTKKERKMSKERELLARVLTSELWSVQEELQAEIKELLAQPEQEPVAWMFIDKETGARIPRAYKPECEPNKDRWELYPLYSAPQKESEHGIGMGDGTS
jgi:hypothetical protein